MGPRLGSPAPGAHAYPPRAQYWRSRRGLTIILLSFLGIVLLYNAFSTPEAVRGPITSAFSSGVSDATQGASHLRSSKAAGSFGGWRGWRASWGHSAANNPSGVDGKGWSGPASPLQSGLSDFKHPEILDVKPSHGDVRLLDPALFPDNEEERKKKEGEDRKKKEEEDRKKKEEEDRKKKEEEERRKKEEEAARKKKEEEEEGAAAAKQNADDDVGQEDPMEDDTNAGERKPNAEDEKEKKPEGALRVTEDEDSSGPTGERPSNPKGLTTTLVMGRTTKELKDVKWVTELLKDITHTSIYVVDDTNAELHLNKNKGRESMVYLKYILDNYDSLDDVTIFHHPGRTAWHNNVLFNRDGAVMINKLRRSWVVEKGYMNARCELYPGCPQWIKWNASAEETRVHYERSSDLFSEELWDRLFPNRTHNPYFLSQPCCSQFAVSREMLRSVPLEQYKVLHDWLGTTNTPDGYTGRIMEYTWQYLFLGKDEHCPDMRECYCKGFGLCFDDEKLKQLKIYNELRFEIDDTMDKLSKWNIAKGCDKIKEEDKEAKNACRANNPWDNPLKKVRGKKMDMERDMPKDWGYTEPY